MESASVFQGHRFKCWARTDLSPPWGSSTTGPKGANRRIPLALPLSSPHMINGTPCTRLTLVLSARVARSHVFTVSETWAKPRLSAQEQTNLARLPWKPNINEAVNTLKPIWNCTARLSTSKGGYFLSFRRHWNVTCNQHPISISLVRIIDYFASECINLSIPLWSRPFSLSWISSWIASCHSVSKCLTLPFSRVTVCLEKLGHTLTHLKIAVFWGGRGKCYDHLVWLFNKITYTIIPL